MKNLPEFSARDRFVAAHLLRQRIKIVQINWKAKHSVFASEVLFAQSFGGIRFRQFSEQIRGGISRKKIVKFILFTLPRSNVGYPIDWRLPLSHEIKQFFQEFFLFFAHFTCIVFLHSILDLDPNIVSALFGSV